MGAKLEAIRQRWGKVWPYLVWVFAGVVGILVLIFVPKMQVPVCPPGQEGLPPKVCFDIENEARRTVAAIEGGLLAIVGIILTLRRIRALERQVLVAQEGQITERFTRAIEQLGSDRMEIRLGGIYALERIANDSDKDYWPIMETLTAYVRENAPWREPAREAPAELGGEKAAHEKAGGEETALAAAATPPAPVVPPKPATDIQAVLTVLGRRKYRFGQGENQSLDLRNTDLRTADLWKAHLEGANLWKAHLEGASLFAAHLERAILWEAHLERASLEGAHLEGAFLGGAHLEGADFEGAHLEEALLWDAHLEGADLRGARGLNREQLAKAILDENTRLPEYLQEQPRENKGPEGNRGE